MKFDTQCIHAGQEPDPSTGAIMTPVYFSSTYVQDGPGVHKGYEYSRTKNPTRFALEKNLSALEGAKFGYCFASGSAATAAILQNLKAGDHVIAGDDLYGGTYRLITQVFSLAGIESTFVDLTNSGNAERAIKPNTRLIWLETPTNPLLKIIDLKAVSSWAKSKNLTVVVDNTFATPYLQKPLDYGADIVVHSATKYLGGHSDVLLGAAVTSDPIWAEKIAFMQNAVGAVPSPMDCFLVLRGLKTLHVRMQRHVENAQEIVRFLKQHPMVNHVYYPGLPEHPGYQVCKNQMKAPGAMISIIVKGGLKPARQILQKTKIFACAESLGGVESLIEHPAIMTHASVPKSVRDSLGIDDGLIRLSVGIEHIDDLVADISNAFSYQSSNST